MKSPSILVMAGSWQLPIEAGASSNSALAAKQPAKPDQVDTEASPATHPLY